MGQGSLVMVEAKHISVPNKKVAGLMECQKLQPKWFGPYRIAAWHNECDIEIERGGRYGLHPRSIGALYTRSSELPTARSWTSSSQVLYL